MKLLIAVIQPTKLHAVRQALAKIGVERFTVCDAHGYGHRREKMEMYRGRMVADDLLRKVALEIAVNDDFLDRTIETITNAARIGSEGSIGDGKILVLPMDEAIQIGPTSRGPEAV